MYSLQNNKKFTLLSAQEFQQKLGNLIGEDKTLNAIFLAEMKVKTFLGIDFYNDFCTAKNVVVDNTNQATLQNAFDSQYPPAGTIQISVGQIVNAIELVTSNTPYVDLWNNFLSEYCYLQALNIAMPLNMLQFTNAGIMINNPVASIIGDKTTASVGAKSSDIKYIQDRINLDMINPLESNMLQYICMHSADFPKFDSAGKCKLYQSTDKDKLKDYRTTSFIDIYKDDCDNGNRRNFNWMD